MAEVASVSCSRERWLDCFPRLISVLQSLGMAGRRVLYVFVSKYSCRLIYFFFFSQHPARFIIWRQNPLM